MKQSKLVKHHRNQFLLYNLIAFFVVLFILSFIAVTIISQLFYRDIDSELQASRNEIVNTDPGRPGSGPKGRNPRIHILIYDYRDYLIRIEMPSGIDYSELEIPSGEEKKYNQKLDGFNYRIQEFSSFFEMETYRVQLLINIDGELALRNNILTVYFSCLTGLAILMIGASYLLSYVTLKPIRKNIEKQQQFISDASHELRTPLTVINSRLESLLTEPNKSIIDISEEITDCLSEVSRLTRLSNNLLTLAKIDAKKSQLEVLEFDILELINQVASPYIENAEIEEKEFRIKGYSIKVKADRSRLLQVLVILFDNALKYTNKGDKITVELRKTKSKCELIIADTGVGISEKGLSQLFERFYRDDFSRSLIEGNGLGLSIARSIINEHGGSISVAHNKPKGLIFTILL